MREDVIRVVIVDDHRLVREGLKADRANIIRKLGLENSQQLVLYAIRRSVSTTRMPIED